MSVNKLMESFIKVTKHRNTLSFTTPDLVSYMYSSTSLIDVHLFSKNTCVGYFEQWPQNTCSGESLATNLLGTFGSI